MAQSSWIRNVLRGKIRVAHVAENSCIFGIPPRSSLEQYLYLSILQEQRACSTSLQQSPTPGWFGHWDASIQGEQTSSSLTQGHCRMHLFSGAFLSPLGMRHRCSHTWKPVLTQTASGDWWLRGNPDWESWVWTLLLPLTRSGKVNCNSLCLSFHIYNAHMLNGRIKRTLKTIWNNKYNKKTLYFRIKQICL